MGGGRGVSGNMGEDVVTICVLGDLLGKEIVGQQGNPLGHQGVRADGVGRALDRLLEVLDHKLHVLVPVGQVDAHEAVGPADVDERAAGGVKVAEVVAALVNVDEEPRLISLAARQACHGPSHAAGSVGILAEGCKHGLLVHRVEGKLEAGASEGGCFWVRL